MPPSPSNMHFRGVGFFPNERRPRVFWCGVEASPNLAELAADIERALEPLGFPPRRAPSCRISRWRDFKSAKAFAKLVQAGSHEH